MARWNTASIGNLTVDKLTVKSDSYANAKYGIWDTSVIAGENGSATLAESSRMNVNASFMCCMTNTINGTPSYNVTAAFDYLGVINGLNIGNMASADRINVMAIKKAQGRFGVVFGGSTTTSAASVDHVMAKTGVLSTDKCFAFVRTQTATNLRTLVKAVCAANQVTFTGNGAFGTGAQAHVIDYVVVRELGSFNPSHEIALAGSGALVAVGAGATDTLLVTGLKTTDILIPQVLTMTEVNRYLTSAAAGSGVINFTFSGAPGITTVQYVAFRAINKNNG